MIKKILIALLLASPALAGGPKYNFSDSKLNDEWVNNYHEHSFPNWVYARGSSATITYVKASTITVSQINATTGTINSFMVAGTATNDNAPAGRIGELIETQQTSGINAAASGSLKEVVSIPLTAGDWDISGIVSFEGQGGVTTFPALGNFIILISQSSAAVGSAVQGYSEALFTQETASTSAYRGLVIPKFRASLSGNQTYYLNAQCSYSSTAPKLFGTLSARRVR